MPTSEDVKLLAACEKALDRLQCLGRTYGVTEETRLAIRSCLDAIAAAQAQAENEAKPVDEEFCLSISDGHIGPHKRLSYGLDHEGHWNICPPCGHLPACVCFDTHVVLLPENCDQVLSLLAALGIEPKART